jgi:Acylphosphatases
MNEMSIGCEDMSEIRKRIVFHGRVQGVGFRYTARHLAQSIGLSGWVRNEYDGTVLMEVQGREPMIFKLMEGLNRSMFIDISWIDSEDIPVEEETSFKIR